MGKDIVIIANFTGDFSLYDNGRFAYLASIISKKNPVEIITSDFDHEKKALKKQLQDSLNFRITYIHEPGYPRNVCLKRFYSHYYWGINVKKYLCTRKKPDVIYCAVPSLTGPFLVSKYCKRNDIKFIIDVQDLWPEAFKMVFHIPLISDLLYMPIKMLADQIYLSADEIITVSDTYTARVKRKNKKAKGYTVYLGTSKKKFDHYVDNYLPHLRDLNILNNNRFKIAYIGTLGHSYDIAIVLKALEMLPKEELEQVEFIVMGDGPCMKELERKAQGLPVNFVGRLSYADMVWILVRCDIAVNPIVPGAAQSIINKHMDYAMAGLPVINTQECEEYRNMLFKYQCGINCRCSCAEDVAKAILEYKQNKKLCCISSRNARRCAEENFNRDKTYDIIVKTIVN